MPRFPVYVDLLGAEARKVIAEVHPHTLPAAKVLMSEGLKYQGYVDIFDAGPTLEANIADLRAVKESRVLKIKLLSRSKYQINSIWLQMINMQIIAYYSLITSY